MDRSLVWAAGVAASCGVLAACVSDGAEGAADREARQCFRPEQVRGFSAIDNRNVLVTVSPQRVFQLELLGTCPDVDWSWQIGLRARSGGWICRGSDAELIIPRGAASVGPQRCPVTNIRQLTDAEVQALRSRSSGNEQGSDEASSGE